MYKITINYNKSECPHVTLQYIFDSFNEEFERQSLFDIITANNIVTFKNNTIKFTGNYFSNPSDFSCFSKGQVQIIEEESVFIIHFQAETKRLFESSLIMAIITTSFSLIFSDFTIIFSSLLLGAVTALFYILIGYAFMKLLFPPYFKKFITSIK